MKFEAIIWDCDGVLIDSETLACGVAADFYTRAGYPLTAHDYIRRFAGQSRAQIAAIIRQENGEDLAAAIDWTLKEAARKAAFEEKLHSIVGVETVLQQGIARGLPMAVASGSSLDRLRHSLKITRLWDFLAPHIYSTEQVSRGKPAPDIFLFAAEKLATDPSRCAVIEDAEHGTRAGKAAGMTVFGFTGASHCGAGWETKLRDAGADAVFGDMHALQAALDL